MNSAEIVNAIEAAQWDFEPELIVPGIYEIRTDTLCLRRSDNSSSPLVNKVVKSIFESNIDRRIDEVFSVYESMGKSFSWWLGQNSKPGDLRERLERRGMRVQDEYFGMGFELRGSNDDSDRTWSVEEAVTEEQLRGHVYVSAVVWGMDKASNEAAVKERIAYVALPSRRGGYLVVRHGNRYVANASYRISADGRTMYLIGGAVLPEYRGKGVYRTLLRYRMQLAESRGCNLLTTQARVGTSESILRRLGFQEYARFAMLV